MSDSPEALALPGVHEAVLARVRPLASGRALDLPAGPGALSRALVELGHTVQAADIAPERFAVPSLSCDRADLDAPLPYADGSFELVVCAEGIEHAENAYHLMRELSRVLAPGGTLVLSTPNPLNLASRLRALSTGFSDVSPRPIRHDEDRLSHHHINPMRLQFLELMVRRAGLELVSLHASRWRVSAVFLGLLLGPWIGLATAWALRARGRPEPMPAVHARVRRLLLSPAALFGRVLIYEVRKPLRSERTS